MQREMIVGLSAAFSIQMGPLMVRSVARNAHRRLAAILTADMVGYSRLMGADEQGTLDALRAHRTELIEPMVGKHEGRIVKLMGDGILAEFPSAVEAVRCAVEIQRMMAERNDERPENGPFRYRIGINLGDVIVEDDDIYGDGVNVAARLEAAGEAGGVLISGAAYDQIKNKIDTGFEFLGERRLKNIADPVRLYRVAPAKPVKLATERNRSTAIRWRWIAAAAAAGLIICAIGVSVWLSVDPASSPLPPKPSIVILPFENLSGNPIHDALADAFTEEITTALSMISEMLVIARRSALAYRGTDTGIPQIAGELGVRYVLNGSVQKQGDQLRVAAQLIDSADNSQIWGKIYDYRVESIFDVQDAVTLRIITALQVELTEGEQERISLVHGTEDIAAWTIGGQARRALLRFTKHDNLRARDLYTRATDRDPNYPGAWEGLAWTHFLDAWFGWSDSRRRSLGIAAELAERTWALDDLRPGTFALLGSIKLMSGDYEQAVAFGERAVSLSPSGADVAALLAMTLTYTGEPERSVDLLEKAMRLSPYHADWYEWTLGRAYRQLGRYDEAIDVLAPQAADAGLSLMPRVELVAALSETGRDDEARAEASLILEADADFSAGAWTQWPSHLDPGTVDREVEALVRAGLPE